MEKIIYSLMMQAGSSPVMLQDMVSRIPQSRLKENRIPGKWNIHQHVCHIATVDELFIHRFSQFKNEERPEIIPFMPGEDEDKTLSEMSMEQCLELFTGLRSRTLELAWSLAPEDWEKQAIHPQYSEYTPLILLRHMVMHDHLHMYRIEDLWLAK